MVDDECSLLSMIQNVSRSIDTVLLAPQAHNVAALGPDRTRACGAKSMGCVLLGASDQRLGVPATDANKAMQMDRIDR